MHTFLTCFRSSGKLTCKPMRRSGVGVVAFVVLCFLASVASLTICPRCCCRQLFTSLICALVGYYRNSHDKYVRVGGRQVLCVPGPSAPASSIATGRQYGSGSGSYSRSDRDAAHIARFVRWARSAAVAKGLKGVHRIV